jgi:Lamin Tail Domain
MRRVLPLIALLLGVLVTLAGSRGPAVRAAQILQNGGFEQWAGGQPLGWSVTGTVTQVSSPVVVAPAARMDGTAGLKQTPPALPGGTYAASARATELQGSGAATLTLVFLNASFVAVGSPFEHTVHLDSSFQTLTVTGVAPGGTAYVQMWLRVAPGGAGAFAAVFDSATLDETPGPPPTATPTEAPTSPSGGSSAVPTATRTPTPTRTPTQPGAPAAPGGNGTPTITATPTATRSATATRAPRLPTVNPAPLPGGPGGLLANGDFESGLSGRPDFWSKFGGSVYAVETAHGGNFAGLLLSMSTSTKWMFQAVSVEPGRWYEARAFVQRPSGEGEMFIRLTWASTPSQSGGTIVSEDSARVSATEWTEVTLGPVQAPPGARGLRFRLMLRPRGPSAALFDDASLFEVDEPEDPKARRPAPDDEDAPALEGIRLAFLAADEEPPGALTLAQGATPSVRITRVLPDPAEEGRDGAFEWVELTNTGDAAVDLRGWQLGDALEADPIPAAELAAGASLIVAGRSALAGEGAAVVRIADGTIGAGLNNEGDSVRLLRPDGSLADDMSYGTGRRSTSQGLAAPGAGQALVLDLATGEWTVAGAPQQSPSAGAPQPAAAPGGAEVGADEEQPPEEPRRPVAVSLERAGNSRAPYYVLGGAAGVGFAGLVGLAHRARRKNGS